MPERTEQFHPMTNTPASSAATAPIAWWLRTVVIFGALLMAAGAVLALVHPAMLVSPHDEINEAVHIYAGYLAARNLAMAILLIVLLSLSAKRALSNLMFLVALIQLLDACIDCAEGRWPIVPGVLILGLIFLSAAAKLSSYPVWKPEFWTP
ncbi:MAG TPA: hypothetical protein VHS13_05215 [Edaphobacter sp.]|jgi:hypothetical protein|nr:hypothetical protein [Edaphobacter sp.]